MKKYIILLILNFVYLNCLSQADEKVSGFDKTNDHSASINQEEIQKLKLQLQKLKDEEQLSSDKLLELQKSTEISRKLIDSLKEHYQLQTAEFTSKLKTLDEKISNSEESNEKRFSGVDKLISQNTLYWLIAFLATALVSALAYVFLSKRQKTDRKEFITQLTEAKSSIEVNLVKEYSKMIELLESQLNLVKTSFDNKSDGTSLDHTFALKVADEITMIERNLSFMDAKTKGLKQLNASVSRLKDNLAADGYEVPTLLGMKFHNGMKLSVINSVQDENLKPGEEVISKVIKPQVNYHGKMIQSAQIEVSVG